MLELKNITKIYSTGSEEIHALKGINLRFRDSEFVSILGPSGCGKTTMLNIIGGLDSYTDGNLSVNGISTKKYKDRDWDTYRNHSVGFVFQSYNLIPHQTVLANVELALTLSGVSKKERRVRAKEALKKVGLETQIKKRPFEMSGGQMQRVAIARAIVNNPDIILADEPTGALDTETSIQVMDILREIAKDRLVIMVTHNPKLAEKYSTRIVNMLDGVITGDSNPISDEEWDNTLKENVNTVKAKKPSMSFATSFGLSLKNLITKKSRTVLTSFAGSIGIIGIALIYAVSAGATAFIDSVQEDALTSYPLTIEAKTVDATTLLETFIGNAKSTNVHENDAVYQKSVLFDLIDSFTNLKITENDLRSFKKFIEEQKSDKDSKLSNALSGVQYTYDAPLLIYTKDINGKIINSDTQLLTAELMNKYMGVDMSSMLEFSKNSNSSMSMMTSSNKLWKELVPGDNGKQINAVTEKQYDIIYGTWPNAYDQVVVFLDENNEIDDMTLYALGLITDEDIENAINNQGDVSTCKKWSYEEICSMEFKTILSSECYSFDEKTQTYFDIRESETGLKYLYDNGLTLKVSGIAKPNGDSVSSDSHSSIGYTGALTKYIIDKAYNSSSVKAQLEDPVTDIFTGLPFKDTEGNMSVEQKSNKFKEYIQSLDIAGKAKIYIDIMGVPTDESIAQFVQTTMQNVTREQIENQIVPSMAEQSGMDEKTITDYLTGMTDEQLNEIFRLALIEKYKESYAAKVSQQLSSMTQDQLAAALDTEISSLTDSMSAKYYDEVLEFSDSSYEDNLITLGCVDYNSPSSINLFSSSFENKDLVEDVIEEYNSGVSPLEQISYTDYVGLMMSSITTIINAITYVLIAFVSVSLIVSSIMIGVITLISVQERTKEIGILRAIGASKRNVSRMFNAETLIIGFTSGSLGVAVTYLICIPINIILHKLTNLNNLNAILPPEAAFILIAISMLLTLFAGIIPSRSASKKDPVTALRTE
ncbi:MAG: ABC transporter ATP-binding protein/permease [Clostridia bacterium]|nr:ABC transporter ATP-binding protein/permease [Clostridia bacterium]